MMNRRDLLTSTLLLSAVVSDQRSQANVGNTLQPQWLEDIAKQLQEEFKLPAVWIAVSTQGRMEAAVVGVRKVGDPTPARLDDILTVASISKPMVGLWIATLVEQGRLTYDSRVLEILPELVPQCLREHRNITLS